MVKMDIDVRVAKCYRVRYGSLTTQGPTLFKGERIPMDVIFKPWVPRALESAVRQHEKYGDVAQLLFVKPHDALLKAMVCFGDPTYRCFTFNEVDIVLTIKEYSTLLLYDFRDPLRIYWKRNIDFRRPLANLMGVPVDTVKARLKDKNGHCISWSYIRDAIGKASGDRHLALFAFAVYRLIVFPKALGYVSVELANFLFQIEKGVNPAPTVLAETSISLNFIRRK
ncbi:hypothetical protein Gohar_002815 [Gossypium harknessii]|uniref:DUF7745 domain-containing protein n=1 Tax=Gossypium harknessii TaxID=34285 RepID=A0A7J9HM10_9ROSI|nr:hypothetical protein [Gossypium harknessii]